MQKRVKILISILSYAIWWAIWYFLWLEWLLMLWIPCIIWAIFGHWYNKKVKQPNKLTNIIAWSNVITWIIPVVGLLTAVSTISLQKLKKNYLILWYIGLIASLTNSIVWVLLNLDSTSIDWSQGNYTFLIVIIVLGIANSIREFSEEKKTNKTSK